MNLDKYQIKAVEGKERNILVVAAPGSGKTTVIINRINHFVEHLRVREENIIVLTFTKAAALNMKERYRNTFYKEKSPFFGTFHGLFYQILLRCNIKVTIIEEFVTKRIIEGVLKKYSDDITEDKIREVMNNISLFKTSRININEFKPSINNDIFSECYESYTVYKKENNLWDFDDLALEVLKLFSENERLLSGYKKLFKYILVDEFQDCDELQIEFLKLMNNGGETSLFAVGDEDQCIYSFRGSKPEYMVTFNKIFVGGKKYFLSKNYRSRKNIIEASKKVIVFNKKRNDKEILWNKEYDGEIICKSIIDEREQGKAISKKIKALKEKGYTYKDNIILYRTNMEAMSIIDLFIRNKIPFSIIDKQYNFFNHFICKDLLAYLSLASNPYDREAFVRIINKPFRYISKNNLLYLKDYKLEKNSFDILIEKEDTPSFQRKKLDELKHDFNFISKSSLGSAIQFIINDLGYMDYLREYSDKFRGSLEDLEEIVEEFKLSASSFKSIWEFTTHIDEVGKLLEESKRNRNEDRVLLSTIHGVKGMEFPNVFMINCNEDTIPHASSKEDNIEEERRLFYVGITRAIDNLYLYVPKMRRGKFKEASRFLEEGELFKETLSSSGLRKGVRLKHKAFGMGIVREVIDDEVKIAFDNGRERRFSGKVLLSNGLIVILES